MVGVFTELATRDIPKKANGYFACVLTKIN